jgi:hypothetical protein
VRVVAAAGDGPPVDRGAGGEACRELLAKVVMAYHSRLLQAHRKLTSRWVPEAWVTGHRPPSIATESGCG